MVMSNGGIHIHYRRHGFAFMTIADLPDGQVATFNGLHLPRTARRRALASFHFC